MVRRLDRMNRHMERIEREAQVSAEALAAGLHAKLVIVAGAGHAANLTHPEPVNAAIAEFLAALPA